MRKTLRKLVKTMLFGVAVCTGVLLNSGVTAFAATTAEYDYYMANEGDTVYKGVVNRNVNIRSGAGTQNSILKDRDGNDVQLRAKDEVAILGREFDEDDVWYHIAFNRNGELLEGHAFGEYIDKVATVLTPKTTPTPIPSPSPTPRPTKQLTPTPVPTVTTPTSAPVVSEKQGNSHGTLLAIIVVFIIIAGGAGAFWYMKKSGYGQHDGENEDEPENNTNSRGPLRADGTPISTRTRRSESEGTYGTPQKRTREKQDEVSILADRERARLMNEEMIRKYRSGEQTDDEEELKKIAASLKEKEDLKEEIDNLRIGDMVYHEYFGKGIVRDNSDVKVIEISFGQDVRFLNKASCASKRLLRKL